MRKAISLVELLIVMAIVVILLIIAVATLNPAGIMFKGRDAQRKKDLSRIKVAFEEYYNDKGCYPDQKLVADLVQKKYCGSNIFSPWLGRWPCDPNGQTYQIVVGPTFTCPTWFYVMTSLENKTDVQQYIQSAGYKSEIGVTMNYAVTSENVTKTNPPPTPSIAPR